MGTLTEQPHSGECGCSHVRTRISTDALIALLAAVLMFTGVGAAAAAPTPGRGTISGTVTKAADGSPAQGVSVSVAGAGGWYQGTTDAAGAYQITDVWPGTYSVLFQDPASQLATQWWKGAETMEDATPVTVTADADIPGIDASLDATVGVAGTVLLDGGSDLRGRQASIAVVARAGGVFAGMTYVHADGSYRIVLKPGTYTVRVEPTEGLAWAVAPQYYSHAATEADATPVVVSKTGDTTGIDFDLASLSATVAVTPGSAPPGGQVHVTASGFAPQEPVQIALHSAPIQLASVSAGADGTVDATVTIPADVPLGDHQIVLTGVMSTLSGSAPLAVTTTPTTGGTDGSGSGGSNGSGSGGGSGTASDPAGTTGPAAQLAATGSDVPVGVVGLAALLLLAGAVLVRIRRRQQA